MLWLMSIGWALNFISAYGGLPQVIGPIVALAIAMFVGVDPLHLIWSAEVPPKSLDPLKSATATSRVASQG